jgi:hypothetical protein
LAVGLVAWLRLRKRRRVARSLYRRQALEELERIAASFDDETSPSPLGPEGMRMGRSNRGFGGRGGSRR